MVEEQYQFFNLVHVVFECSLIVFIKAENMPCIHIK